MLAFKGTQDRCYRGAFKSAICILIYFMIFSPLSSAISVSPAYVDAGVLESGEAYVYSFEIINRLSSSVPVNIDFELTQSSKYLENNTMFFPSSLVVNPDESNIHFSVLIVGTENITEGDHLLLFRPIPTPILQAEINASYDMNVASYILQTTVAGINFTISPADEVIVPTYSTGGTSRSSVVTLISEPMSTVEIVDETKNIMITNPWFFRVAQENETLYIKIKNMGPFNFTDLALTIAATPELDVDYDSRISSLLSGEEKTVEINMSGFSNTYHLLSIIVSDGADEWEKNVIVYVPEEPRESMSRDCIIFEPKNVTVRGSSESQINLSILNACDFSIHNLNVVVAGLNHIGHMGTIEPNKRYIFDYPCLR